MKNGFFTLHPAVSFVYFTAVILFSMVFTHPAFVLTGLACALILALHLHRDGAVKALRFLLPTAVFFAVLNPLINRRGRTILHIFENGRPVTLEAVAYGAVSAMMFMSVILWFVGFNRIMTSDRLTTLFGRALPAFSLLFCMTLRFIPRCAVQFRKITSARRSIGLDPMSGKPRERLKNALSVLSIMTTWAFENGVNTADSMRSRGYGLPGRTAFLPFRTTRRDVVTLILEIALIAGFLVLASVGGVGVLFYPTLEIAELNAFGLAATVIYAFFCLLPLTIELVEAFRWNCTKSGT